MGGGGGGAGVDGAGGGGGSGFVNRSAVYQSSTVYSSSGIVPDAPAVPVVLQVNDSTISIGWSPPSYIAGAEPASYQLEMAKGPSSRDFELVTHISGPGSTGFSGTVGGSERPDGSRQFDIFGLDKESTYRFRVRATSRTSGSGLPSKEVTVHTSGTLNNRWRRIWARPWMHAATGGGRRQHDLPTEEQPMFPSARRGHSTVIIGGFLYLFGGVQDGHECGTALMNDHRRGLSSINPAKPTTVFCRKYAGASNEVWRYDPRISQWAMLNVEGTPPVGRERHTASVAVKHPGTFYDGKMLVFGGHAGGSGVNKDGGWDGKQYLGDLWELETDAFVKATVDGYGSNPPNKPVRDMRNLFVSTTAEMDSDMCVADVNVRVWLEHGCTSDIQIELMGPGHRHQGAMHRESLSRQHGVGSSFTEDSDPSHAEDPPLARDATVMLFDSLDGTFTGCGKNLEGITFDDQAVEAVDGGSFSPFKGSYRPLSPLSAFNGLQARGKWTLHVYDKLENQLEGVLKKWEIHFELRACEARYTWRELTHLTVGDIAHRYVSKI